MRNYFIYFVLVFSCFMLFISPVSFAAKNFVMNEIHVKVGIEDLLDSLVEEFNLKINKTFRVGSSSTYNTFDNFKSLIFKDNNNCFHFAYFYNGNGRSYFSSMTTGYQSNAGNSYSTGSFTVNSGVTINNLADTKTGYWSSFSSNNNVGASTNNNNYDYYVLLRDASGKWFEYSSSDFSVSKLSALKFVESSSWGTITIDHDNDSFDFTRINFDRSIGSSGLSLGYFTGYEGYDLEISCGPYVGSWDSYTVDLSWGKAAIYSGDIFNGNKIYLREEGGRLYLYINPSRYLYEQGYGVAIWYKSHNNGEWDAFKSLNFICLPYGDNRSSGDFLINPNLNNTTDMTMINAFDDYLKGDYESSQNNPNGFYGGLLNPFYVSGESGDFFGISGDLIGRLGLNNEFVPTDNEDLFLSFLENLKSALLNVGDTYIDFEYRGQHYVFFSHDFTTPNGTIKSICSVLLTAGLMFLLIQQYWRLFKYLRTLDFISAVNSFNVDVDVFM